MARCAWLWLVAAVLLAGCGEGPRRTPNPVGEWTSNVGGGLLSTLSIQPDGGFTGNIRQMGQRAMNIRGTWSTGLHDNGVDAAETLQLNVESVNGEPLGPEEDGQWPIELVSAPEGIDLMVYLGVMTFTRPGKEEETLDWWKGELERLREGG